MGIKTEPEINRTPKRSSRPTTMSALRSMRRLVGVIDADISAFDNLSAVRGEMRAESDVDITVEFEPGVYVGLIKFESLAEELEVLAGRGVDLVTRRGLKPWVRPAVLKGPACSS
jgi:predicted nucleotidyltransferase